MWWEVDDEIKAAIFLFAGAVLFFAVAAFMLFYCG